MTFTPKQFQEFIDRHGNQHNKIRNSRTNGQAERVNKTVLNVLKCVRKRRNHHDREGKMEETL